MTDSHRIPFALGADGNPVSVEDVSRGKACNCTCPSCGAPLVANKGERRLKIWHFSHAAGTACTGALESSLHLAMKDIIATEKRLLVPPCTVLRHLDSELPEFFWSESGEYVVPPYRYTNSLGIYQQRAKDKGLGLAQRPSRPQLLVFDEVIVEQVEGNIRPDLIGVMRGKRLLIEIAVTHFIDGEKLRKIRDRETAALQVVVPYSEAMNWVDLRKIVLEATEGKAWAYNPVAEAAAEKDYEEKAGYRQALQKKMEARIAADQAQARRKIKWLEHIEQKKREERAKEAQQRALKEIEHKKERERQAIKREQQRKIEQAKYEAQAAIEADQLRQKQETEAEELRLKNEVEAAKAERIRKKHNALIKRIQTGKPSTKWPLHEPILFLDLDSALHNARDLNARLEVLAAVIKPDTICSFVVTSEVRYTKTAEEIAEILAPLGGRHVSCTPVLDANNPYGTRQREIDAWLAKNRCSRWYVLDGSRRGFQRSTIYLPIYSTSDDQAEDLQRWLGVFRRLY